jgi:hypothetical protein
MVHNYWCADKGNKLFLFFAKLQIQYLFDILLLINMTLLKLKILQDFAGDVTAFSVVTKPGRVMKGQGLAKCP